MTEPDQSRSFTLSRRFEAPLDTVWQAWSDPQRLARWWGPQGCTIEVLRFEFRPGGIFHYAMRFPGMPDTWGRFLYREIDGPRRLMWLNSFANARGGIARAPFSSACPMEIENAVTFAADGQATVVSLVARPFGELDAEGRYFDELQPALQQGYGGTFDQLGALLGER